MDEFDELWSGGPRLCRAGEGFKLSTDSVLLADFASSRRAHSCLDLGSGAGVLSILLAFKNSQSEICGIELQPQSAETCRKNIAANGMDERVKIINADLRKHRELIAPSSFDLVVSNPPYFAQNSGETALKAERALARGEENCTLADICTAAKWALRYGGLFALVHRPERLSEIFAAMTAVGIEPKRLRMVSHTAERAPCLVLVEGKLGGKKGLKIEPPLILKTENGENSPEILKIYHMA
ncbi:MAG: methyltransferase [Oscillospiraceae bacterium]